MAKRSEAMQGWQEMRASSDVGALQCKIANKIFYVQEGKQKSLENSYQRLMVFGLSSDHVRSETSDASDGHSAEVANSRYYFSVNRTESTSDYVLSSGGQVADDSISALRGLNGHEILAFGASYVVGYPAEYFFERQEFSIHSETMDANGILRVEFLSESSELVFGQGARPWIELDTNQKYQIGRWGILGIMGKPQNEWVTELNYPDNTELTERHLPTTLIHLRKSDGRIGDEFRIEFEVAKVSDDEAKYYLPHYGISESAIVPDEGFSLPFGNAGLVIVGVLMILAGVYLSQRRKRSNEA